MWRKSIKKYAFIAGTTVALCGTFGLTNAYAGESEPEVIEINAENFPDEAFREYVLAAVDTNDDGKLSLEERLARKNIYVAEEGIATLKGIEYFSNLEGLNCHNNDIEELDVSMLQNNKKLYCHNCDINTLNIGNFAI